MPNPPLTTTSAVVAELFDKVDVVGRFDCGTRPIKERDRGTSAGELLVGVAQSQLLGAKALAPWIASAPTRLRLGGAGVRIHDRGEPGPPRSAPSSRSESIPRLTTSLIVSSPSCWLTAGSG